MDGTGEGPEITDAFTSYCVILSGTGNLLDIRVSIDNLDAGDEDIALDNFQLFSDQASGTPPVTPINTTLAIAPTDADKAEGDAGTTNFTFTVTRSGDLSGTTSVGYQVTGSGGDPADAADFGGTLPSGMVNFTATETTQTITIPVSGDTDVENDEGFTVTLSNPTGGATITTATANGTIQNDDVDTYELRIIKYNDLDQNTMNNELNTSGVQNPSGNALTGWEFIIYDSNGNEVGRNTTSVESTGANGDLGIRASFPGLISGEEYTICETQQTGWVNTQPGTINPTYGEPCETVTLTSNNVVFRYFGNYAEPGTLLVQKVLSGAGDPNNPNQTFELDITDANGVGIAGATVTPGQNPVGLGFAPGSYGVREVDIPTNWTLTNIVCESVNGNSTSTFGTFVPGENSLDVELGAGDRVVCTFTNEYTPTGSITIRKNVDNDFFNDLEFDFTFNGSTDFSLSESGDDFVVTDLPAGDYPVTEVVPANWDLASIDCGQGNNNTALSGGLTIVLEPGENEVCTFNNNYLGETGNITIRKNVDDDNFADLEFDFVFNGDTPFSLSENGNAFVLENIPVGNYPVIETVPTNWDLVSIN